MRFLALLTSLLLGLAACSDDSGTTPGKDAAPIVDIGGPDMALPDVALPDAAKPDAADDAAKPDGTGDAAKPDAAGDAKKPDVAVVEAGPKPDIGSDMKLDAGNQLVYGSISRSVLPVNDGIGNLHIAVVQVVFPFPITVASKMIKRADLSKAGAKVNYSINATLASGTYTINAWMDDNNNTWSPLAMAGEGDLVMSAGIKTTMGGATATKVDLVLDKLSQLGATDAGVSSTALKGKITAKVVPSGDGKGPIIFSLHTNVPPAGLIASGATVLVGGDLSTPFQSEAYYFSGVTSGKYYLRAFLDDNGNAIGLLGVGNPDKGDMITSKPVQVHVVNGQVTVRDVVLDALQK